MRKIEITIDAIAKISELHFLFENAIPHKTPLKPNNPAVIILRGNEHINATTTPIPVPSSAMGDLLGEGYSLAQKDKAYRCLDLLLKHRDDLFHFLKEQWSNLFGAKYDVLLYDLTSTYFESDPPAAGSGSKKRFGYSRDKRSDCVQAVVALVLTPEGFPVAYEVYPGNTRDTATVEEFLDRIEKQYGKLRRTWLMDRGIPTEKMLEEMRSRGIDYLVGTPRGHLTRVEKQLLEQP